MARKRRPKRNRLQREPDDLSSKAEPNPATMRADTERETIKTRANARALRSHGATPNSRKRWLGLAAIVFVILLPLLSYWIYDKLIQFPSEIPIAIGPVFGRHETITESLKHAIESLTESTVQPHPTRGSLDNLRMLQAQEIDFALHQTGTEQLLAKSEFEELDHYYEEVGPHNADTAANTGDGRLDFEEYRSRSPMRESSDEQKDKAKQAFERLDTDGDNYLSVREFSDTSSIRVVANLYSEFVHFLVPRDANISSPADIADIKSIAMGARYSGHFAMGLTVLEHLGLAEGEPDNIVPFIDVKYEQDTDEDYCEQIEQGFSNGDIDAAIFTAGLHAPFLQRLLASGDCDLVPIPNADALTTKNVLVSKKVIPAGTYRSKEAAVPAQDVQTVAVRAQLLTREDVNPELVRTVTEIVLSEDFQKENQLVELFTRDRLERLKFAQEKPEFRFHRGAESLYHPEGFDPGAFEGWEALYSLIASVVIAMFFGIRWLKHKRTRRMAHKLDQCIASLLDIERQQMSLDASANVDDASRLQKLLDDITSLRQNALNEFTIHQLKEDPGTGFFIEMSFALSDKINVKISRQRLDRRFEELIGALKGNASGARE